jgi:Multiubiquitin
MAESAAARAEHADVDPGKARFVFDVDGVTFEWNRPKITGAEIMEAAEIPISQGLVLCDEDGSQETVAADREVHLVPRPRFKQRPRFKRGMQ